MSISIKCQACNTGFRVPDELAGRKGKCPKCGQVLVVPAAAAPNVPATPASPRKSPPPPPVPTPLAAKAPPTPAEPTDGLLGIQFAPPPTPGSGSSVTGKHKKKPAPAATAQSETDATESSSTVFTRRKRQAAPAWIWLVMVGMGLVIVAGGAFYLFKDALTPTIVAQNPPPAAAASPAPESEAANPAPPAPTGPQPADISKLVAAAVVRIEVQQEGDPETSEEKKGGGSGFIIHRSGLVATNYQVVAECTKAEVVLSNGERIPVAGYVALRPDCDLAILKLEGMPADLVSLALSTETPRADTAVYCVGHSADQLEVASGFIAEVSATADLPESSKEFLKEALAAKANAQWIKHNALVPAVDRGGPLVNAKGEVVGIQTFVDEASQTGFAVDASHLDGMRRRLLALAPLAKYRRRPQPALQSVAAQAATPANAAMGLSSERVGELISQLAAKEWQAESEEDYELFAQLAMALGQAQEQRKKMEREPGGVPLEVKLVEQQADETVAALKDVPWMLETNIPAINRLAAANLAKKGAGVLLFAAYKYPDADAQKQKGMVLRMEGSKQEIFVPYKLPPDLPEDTFFLILGTAQGPVQLGDNPLLAVEVPRVVPSLVFEIAPR